MGAHGGVQRPGGPAALSLTAGAPKHFFLAGVSNFFELDGMKRRAGPTTGTLNGTTFLTALPIAQVWGALIWCTAMNDGGSFLP